MSTTRNDKTVKTSYKSAVALLEDVPVIETSFNDNHYTIEYDSIEPIKLLVAKDMKFWNTRSTLNHVKPLPLPMRYFMSDAIEPFGDLTNQIKELYELKGIANTLKLSDVLNAFESSVRVVYLGDIDIVEPSLSDEEIVQVVK